MSGRGGKWAVLGLLFLATTINYMDRVTLSSVSVRVTGELGLNNEQYGHLELAFGWAFALGSFCFGMLADRVGVRRLYPFVLGAWSLMGVLTGWSTGFMELLVCRGLLGFFEAGHWPCAVKTTMLVMSDRERTFGNSVLQAGSSVGAIVTPQVMKLRLTADAGSWRNAFVMVGCVGFFWIIPWLWVSRGGRVADEQREAEAGDAPRGEGGSEAEGSIWRILTGRRFWAVAVLVCGINVVWQIYRVWMMKFLQQGRGLTERAAMDLNSLYYLATDVGCIGAGALSVWLVGRGLSAHGARRRVYLGACWLTGLSVFLPVLKAGWLLGTVLMIVGAGALGLFPCYYSFVQDLSERHVGKLTGLLSMWVWAVTSPLHSFFGGLVDRTGSYDAGLVLAGLAPWAGVAAMRWGWGRADEAVGK